MTGEQLEPELIQERSYGRLRRPDPLPAELERLAGDLNRVQPPTDPVARFHHDDVDARVRQAPGSRQAGDSGADDHDIHMLLASRSDHQASSTRRRRPP